MSSSWSGSPGSTTRCSRASPFGCPTVGRPQQTLDQVRVHVIELSAAQSQLWRDDLCPALAAEGIRVGSVDDATSDELEDLERIFLRQIYPVLTPLAVGPGQPFPYISGLSLSLGVMVRDDTSGEERFARVKVPEGLPRFVPIGTDGLRLPLEAIIGHFLPVLFPEMEVLERVAFRVTRDGDTEISDDADDLLEAVESELRKRRFGAVVRLEVSSSISRSMLSRLETRLGISSSGVYPMKGLLDLADLGQLYSLDRPDLKYEPWVAYTQRRLLSPKNDDLFAEIAQRDLVVQHPYDSFSTSVESFVKGAARDEAVVAIKTTVYRTTQDSALANALVEAAENGKQCVCVVELKARFDEQRNIEWARSLEQAGVHVVYGFPDMKIHAKTTLIVRREGDELRRYVHIGTGNYHATTARIYEDIGLFTADPEITADVADLFNFVTGFGRPQRFRKLLVAPFNLKKSLIEHIRSVAAAAEAGRARPHSDQVQQHHAPRGDRRAVPGLAGRRRDRHRGARDLRTDPGHPRAQREHPRAFDPRSVPRAQPSLLLRRRRRAHVLARKRGPDAPQPRPSDRGRRAGRRSAHPG